MSMESFSNEQNKNTSEVEPVIENSTSIEKPAEPDAIKKYEDENRATSLIIEATQTEIAKLGAEIDTVRTRLFGENEKPTDEPSSVVQLRETLEELEEEKIKTSANYPGDWTLLLRDRMLDPVTKEKFIKTRQEAMLAMNDGEVGRLDKPKTFVGHYQQQIDNYDENVTRIFNSTEYKNAEEDSKKPIHLGAGNIGEVGVVFKNAEIDGKGLIPRQKNIIEAHEKGHGLRDFTAPTDSMDFRNSVNGQVVEKLEEEEQKTNPEKRFSNYINQPEEIAERMVQLKNYFGMKAEDVFTRKHLEYAKEHYVRDTDLDNNMSVFLGSVDDSVVDKFIETINKYPL